MNFGWYLPWLFLAGLDYYYTLGEKISCLGEPWGEGEMGKIAKQLASSTPRRLKKNLKKLSQSGDDGSTTNQTTLIKVISSCWGEYDKIQREALRDGLKVLSSRKEFKCAASKLSTKKRKELMKWFDENFTFQGEKVESLDNDKSSTSSSDSDKEKDGGKDEGKDKGGNKNKHKSKDKDGNKSKSKDKSKNQNQSQNKDKDKDKDNNKHKDKNIKIKSKKKDQKDIKEAKQPRPLQTTITETDHKKQAKKSEKSKDSKKAPKESKSTNKITKEKPEKLELAEQLVEPTTDAKSVKATTREKGKKKHIKKYFKKHFKKQESSKEKNQKESKSKQKTSSAKEEPLPKSNKIMASKSISLLVQSEPQKSSSEKNLKKSNVKYYRVNYGDSFIHDGTTESILRLTGQLRTLVNNYDYPTKLIALPSPSGGILTVVSLNSFKTLFENKEPVPKDIMFAYLRLLRETSRSRPGAPSKLTFLKPNTLDKVKNIGKLFRDFQIPEETTLRIFWPLKVEDYWILLVIDIPHLEAPKTTGTTSGGSATPPPLLTLNGNFIRLIKGRNSKLENEAISLVANQLKKANIKLQLKEITSVYTVEDPKETAACVLRHCTMIAFGYSPEEDIASSFTHNPDLIAFQITSGQLFNQDRLQLRE